MIRQWVRTVFSEELKMTDEQIKDDMPFDEYGIDSILFAELVQSLQKRISIKLTPSLMLQYQTITEMVDYFAAHHEADFVTKENGFVQDRDVEPDVTAAAEERTFMEPKADTEDDIAVVGMSCRFPGRAERMLLGAADERKHRHPACPRIALACNSKCKGLCGVD